MNRLSVIGLVAIAAALIGCGGSGNGLVNNPNPRVRFANLFPSIASAKAKVGPDTISDNIAFGAVSDYTITPNGNKDLTAGDSTFDNLATLSDQLYETNKRYTGVGYGTAPRSIILLEEDKSQSGSDTIAVRAVNAAQAAGSLDVYISAAADPLPASPSAEVAVGATSNYSTVPATGTNQYRIRVFADGNTTTALVDKTITVDDRDRISFVIYNDAGAGTGVNALVLTENL